MIIEDLIRTGRLLTDGGISDEQMLLLISDVTSPQVRNFFQHVFVVEIPEVGSQAAPAALPMQAWGSHVQPDPKKKKTVFEVDVRKAVSAPFVFPGGNPIHPQGVYGVPVFPVFEKHLDGFRENPSSIESFLDGRLKRCPSLQLSEDQRRQAAEAIHDRIQRDNPQGDGKTLCLLVLVDANNSVSPFCYTENRSDQSLGASQLFAGKSIHPRLDRISQLFRESKFAEGAEVGSRDGECSVCGNDSGLVSIYCKSWPWFLPTWTCPLPDGGSKKLIVEGIAIDEPCYSALNCGASYFGKMASPIDSIVTRELFSPVADSEGRQTVQHKSISDLPTVYGAILLLPILNLDQMCDEERQEFGENLAVRLYPERASRRLQQHVERIVGFHASLPDDIDDETYRLSLYYYSGDPSRGDIHLRAVVEDVIPSALKELCRLAADLPNCLREAFSLALPNGSDKQQAYHATRLASVPYLLAKGYGGPYLWEQLQRILRRAPLDPRRPVANVAHRISSLVGRLPKTEFTIREEVLFHLVFQDFLAHYNQTIARGGDTSMPMRHWSEMLQALTEEPPENMSLNGAAELGFACGYIVRQFSRQYWTVTKVGKEGKDYLKHRVLTFGSDLSPDLVWKKALPGIFNVEAKLDKISLNDDLRRRIAILLNQCENQQEAIRAERDNFMAAFWSGYALQKSDKPSPPSNESR